MKILAGAVLALVLPPLIADPHVGADGSCRDLAKLAFPNTTITLAQTVEAGSLTLPVPISPERLRSLSRFCRVAATLRPTGDSDIKMELWLPESGWNGKFEAVGNGAFNGAIGYSAMIAALIRGYATSSTDTGHVGNTGSFGLGHPEKVIDFGWRAVHEMTSASKRIIAGYYDASPKFSYWNGCSAGGRQAMKEAQRFPADFDGIIAGAPGLDWTGRAAQAMRVAGILEHDVAARLSPAERQLLHRAVIDACDSIDGVKDGLIENPTRCKFDPGVLQCKNPQDRGCLTREQTETARLMYSPIRNPKTNRVIAGLAPGSELGWTDMGWTESARATGLDQFRFLVFGDPTWDLRTFNVDSDVARADEIDGDTINAFDPNLKPFFDRGGKLIQYHGWSDAQIAPENSTQYYARVLETLGARLVQGSYRLFMAPGMGHCGGGEGPNTFDMVPALEQWIERRNAPDQVVAAHSSHGVVDRTRPLCPYPQVAAYKGAGSPDDAANFVCSAR